MALLSLILTSCYTSKAPYEIDYRAINCAGWGLVSVSKNDTLETKRKIAVHNHKYLQDCASELLQQDRGKLWQRH